MTSLEFLLQPLLTHLEPADVSDLCMQQAGEVHRKQDGRWQMHRVPTLDSPWMRAFITAAATAAGLRCDAQHPFLSSALSDGLRLEAIVPPAVAGDAGAFAIRKLHATEAPVRFVMKPTRIAPVFERPINAAAVRADALWLQEQDGALAGVLGELVSARRNLLIVGATGAGKTTLLAELLRRTSMSERIVSIEDAFELRLASRNWLALRAVAGVAGVGRCLTACLRLAPDRVILAELRGVEAFDFLNVLRIGHRGSMTTFHAGSAVEAIERLVLLVSQHAGAVNLSPGLIARLIAHGLDTMLLIRPFDGGRSVELASVAAAVEQFERSLG